MKYGEKWGRLTCVSAGLFETKVMASDGAGGEYAAETHYESGYVLQCECGRKWEVMAEKFEGKRKVKDCGCGLGKDDGRPVMISVSMGRGLSDHVEEWARVNANGNRSLGISMLLRAGLKSVGSAGAGNEGGGSWE